jgi:hypothetical protein
MTETMPLFERPSRAPARNSPTRRTSAPSGTADTRRDAAASIDGDPLQHLQQRVLETIAQHGHHGMTDEELRRSLPDLAPDTPRARRTELTSLGLVADSGERRRTARGRFAIVWVATGQPPSASARAPRHEHLEQVDQAADDQAPAWLCPRCGCATWQDVPIHCGQSLRRDCARCGLVARFVTWYGREVPPP